MPNSRETSDATAKSIFGGVLGRPNRLVRWLGIPAVLAFVLVAPLVAATWYGFDLRRAAVMDGFRFEMEQTAALLAAGMRDPIRNQSAAQGRLLLATIMADPRLIGVQVTSVAGGEFLSAGGAAGPAAAPVVFSREIRDGGARIGAVRVTADAAKMFATLNVPWRRIVAAHAIQWALVIAVGILVAWGANRLKDARELGRVNRRLTAEVAQHERTEAALRESEEKFRSIVEHSPSAIFLKDIEGRYRLANRKFEEWYGKREADVIGKKSHEIFPEAFADAYVGIDEEVLRTGKVQTREVAAPYSDGTVHAIVTTKFPVPGPDGTTIGVGTINMDVTSQRRAEEQLRQAQKMEAVGQLTGGLAHDFNNLLTVVLGNLDLLRDITAGDAGAGKLVRAAIRASERGAELTQRLLAFSRKQALSPRVTDVNQLVAGMIQLMRRTLGAKTEIKTVLAEDLWEAMVDRGQLESALVNLAINARDAMPEGGELTIESRNTDLDQAFADEHDEVAPGAYVMLTVRDTGTGMPPQVLRHAFEPFYTTKPVGEGSGLGLSMVYGFVKQSGGHVEIDSMPGAGTRVALYLPRAAAVERRQDGQAPPPAEAPGGAETVLVVEDDPDVRQFVVAVLQQLGYAVHQAADGRAAFALLDRAGPIDLLLTDVVLTGDKNGSEVAAAVRAQSPETAVLFMSGYSEDAIQHQGRLDGDVELLAKPFTKAMLASRVRRALDRARQ